MSKAKLIHKTYLKISDIVSYKKVLCTLLSFEGITIVNLSMDSVYQDVMYLIQIDGLGCASDSIYKAENEEKLREFGYREISLPYLRNTAKGINTTANHEVTPKKPSARTITPTVVSKKHEVFSKLVGSIITTQLIILATYVCYWFIAWKLTIPYARVADIPSMSAPSRGFLLLALVFYIIGTIIPIVDSSKEAKSGAIAFYLVSIIIGGLIIYHA